MGCVVSPEIETNTNPREGKEWGMKLERRIKGESEYWLQPAAASYRWVEPACLQELRNDADIWIFPLGELADSEWAVQGCNPTTQEGTASLLVLL